ncbi:M23 family metallopeptidase [Ichthyenterobacterium sp. W332]|uniref:M23 family metallopeptidase n=1 Tax=Microcosmobacter mediterraneus TaxID=3075607 RepID=A0ABU2YKY7_9FLAO|nr:M23 family metallopeptidase [Ichthyenterobacterium sp. W332]MDT0558833.1 M23 family metallopeptidase [Ichthyenterobacterium sp. W332]
MKSFYSLIFLLIVVHLHSQNIPKPEVLNIDFSVFNNEEKTTKKDSITSKIVIDSVHLPNITSEYWIHTVYNPYKNMSLKFPLSIKFKDSTYAQPVDNDMVVTSRFGWRRGRAHKGIDIDLVTGDSVYAVLDGVVRFVRYSSGHGRTVIVRHYNGLETVYAHLSQYGVKENDTIIKGQYLGKGGTSGNARGSHLHFVVNYKGVSINPEYIFKFDNSKAIRSKELWITKKWTRAHFHNSKRQSKLELLTSKDEALASLEKQRKIYIVRRGDTLSRISKRNNVPISAICKTNLIKRNATLRIGQKLVLEL